MANENSCPACDAKCLKEDTVCPQCGIMLSIFDGEMNAVGIPGRECEPYLGQVLDGIENVSSVNEEQYLEKVRAIGRSVPVSVEQFACPSCGQMLLITAKSCEKCGAEFAEETIEQFQCPICSKLVDSTATKCPGCGAEFADEAEGTTAEGVSGEANGQIAEKKVGGSATEVSADKKDAAENGKDEPDKEKKVDEADGKKKKSGSGWMRLSKKKK